MNPKDMNQPSLRQLSKDLAYMATYMDRVCFVRTAEECRLAAKECTAYADEIDALRKENEELRKDKERLDWLEKHDVWLDVSGEYDINPLDTAGKSYIQTVRKMIDKTRAKESEASHE